MKWTIYTIIVLDMVLVFCLATLYLFLTSILPLAFGFPVLLVFNYVLLRRRTWPISAQSTAGSVSTRHAALWLYAGASIFIGGGLYGLVLLASGGLPWPLLPVLAFPLALALYFLRTAKRISVGSGKRRGAL